MGHTTRWAWLCLLLTALSEAADWRAELPAAQRLGVGEFSWFGLRLYTAQLWQQVRSRTGTGLCP